MEQQAGSRRCKNGQGALMKTARLGSHIYARSYPFYAKKKKKKLLGKSNAGCLVRQDMQRRAPGAPATARSISLGFGLSVC